MDFGPWPKWSDRVEPLHGRRSKKGAAGDSSAGLSNEEHQEGEEGEKRQEAKQGKEPKRRDAGDELHAPEGEERLGASGDVEQTVLFDFD